MNTIIPNGTINRPSGRITKQLFGTVLLAVFASSANSTPWQWSPRADVRLGYDDNVTLNPFQDNGSYEINADAAVTAEKVADRYRLSTELGTVLVDYFDSDTDTLDDEANIYASLSGHYDISSISQIGSSLLYQYDYTGTTQRFDSGDIDTDLALVRQQVRRDRLTLSPYWHRELNERVSFEGRYRYIDVSYDSISGPVSLTDYSTHQLNLQTDWQLSENNTLSTLLRGDFFESSGGASERDVDSYAIVFTLNHRLSPLSFIAASIGYRDSTQDSIGADESDEGVIAKLMARKRTELMRLQGSVERKLTPSGSGNVIESDVVSARLERRVSEKLGVSLDVRYFSNSPVFSNSGGDKRDYTAVEPAVNFTLNETWSAAFSYRYRNEDRDSLSLDADSHAVYLSVSYRPMKEG